jgi:hypothetical protein
VERFSTNRHHHLSVEEVGNRNSESTGNADERALGLEVRFTSPVERFNLTVGVYCVDQFL